MTSDILTPRDAADVLQIVQEAVQDEAPLEILGHGSKRGYGRPVQASRTLDLSALAGITLYEPAELVLRAAAGTPLMTIKAALAAPVRPTPPAQASSTRSVADRRCASTSAARRAAGSLGSRKSGQRTQVDGHGTSGARPSR